MFFTYLRSRLKDKSTYLSKKKLLKIIESFTIYDVKFL